MTQRVFQVKVFRYNPDKDHSPYYQSFIVPYKEQMTVLDTLNHIYEYYDPTLAYRWNCRAGQCGSCAILLNGKPCLACRTQIDPKVTSSITPLLQFPVIKDIVVNLERGVRRLEKTRPYLERMPQPSRPEKIKQEEIQSAKELRKCIECWACVSACPVITEAWQDFSGPIVMRQLARLKFDPRDVEDRVKTAFIEGVYSCTTCGTCSEVCPKSINIHGKAIEKLRAYAVDSGIGPLEGQRPLLKNIDATGKSVEKTTEPFLEKVPEIVDSSNAVDEVLFFTGCLIDYRMQESGMNVLKVLQACGVKTYLPKGQSCCGSPAFRIGKLDLAERQARRNIELFESLGVEKIITACAGCGMTMKKNYPEISQKLMERPLGFKVYDFTEYLVKELGLERLRRILRRSVDLTVTWHDPCHLKRGQGITEEPLSVIRSISGLKVLEMKDVGRCCGSGGGVRAGKRPLSMAMGRRLGELIVGTQADLCATECPFCTIQIKDVLKALGSEMQVANVADLLAMAM